MSYRALILALALIFSAGFFSVLFAESEQKTAEPDFDFLLRQKPSMRVVVVRHSEPGCEPNCTEWISAEGVIMPDTPNLFAKILNGLGSRKLPVFISSSGGVVDAAMSIGRMMRAHQLDVAVSKTDFKPCPGDAENCAKDRSSAVYGLPHANGAFCASACTFILAGGSRRFVAPWARVGVHQITMFEKRVQRILTFKTTTTFTSPDSGLAPRQSFVGERVNTKIVKLDVPNPETLKSIRDFFKDMGISEQLQSLAEATKPNSLHWMTYTELSATHLATDTLSSEFLTDPPAETAQSDRPDVTEFLSSFGIFRMESFTRRPVFILLEFYRRKDEPNLEVFAFLSDRDQFVSNANFALAIQFGSDKRGMEVEAKSQRPFAPIHTTFAGSNLCEGHLISGDSKLTLIQVTKGARLAGPTMTMDLLQLTGMNELTANLCDK